MQSDLKISDDRIVVEGNSLIVEGSLGVGVTMPEHKIDIAGRIRIKDAGETAGIWLHHQPAGKDLAFVGMSDDQRVGLWGNAGAGWGLVMDIGSGNVGIGVESPKVKLDIAGTVKSETAECREISVAHTTSYPKEMPQFIVDAQIASTTAASEAALAAAQHSSAPNNPLYLNNSVQAQNKLQAAATALEKAFKKFYRRTSLSHDGKDRLTINKHQNYTGGVDIDGEINLNNQISLSEGKIRIFYESTANKRLPGPLDKRFDTSNRRGNSNMIDPKNLTKTVNFSDLSNDELKKLGWDEIDLVATLLQLTKKVADLQTQIDNLKPKG